MKTLKLYAFLGTVIAAMIFSGCSKNDDLDQSFYDASSKQSSESLTAAELDGLLFMAEKQKLQRDVYMGMYERNPAPIFNELYLADRKNLEMVSEIIEAYGQKNPALNKGIGDFKRAEIQAIYDEFITSVDNDLIEMLTFALEMENGTAAEIRSFMSEVDGNPDISQLYSELLYGSDTQLDALDEKLKEYTIGIQPLPITGEN